LDLSGSGLDWFAGFRKDGNEPSASVKGGEFLDNLSVLLASQEELCSMEFVG
jgi:hypothetical protein